MEQPYCYRDGRTTGMPERVAGLLTPAELYARTGTAPLPLQTIFQLKAAQDGLHLAGAAHALLDARPVAALADRGAVLGGHQWIDERAGGPRAP